MPLTLDIPTKELKFSSLHFFWSINYLKLAMVDSCWHLNWFLSISKTSYIKRWYITSATNKPISIYFLLHITHISKLSGKLTRVGIKIATLQGKSVYFKPSMCSQGSNNTRTINNEKGMQQIHKYTFTLNRIEG